MFTKGINAWSMPDDLTFGQQFKIAKDAGFNTIELNISKLHRANNGQINTLTMKTDEKTLTDILKISQEYSLPISSISTDLHWQYPLNSSDGEMQSYAIAIAKKMIDYCKVLGGDTVLIVPGIVNEKLNYEDTYERSLKAIQELADYAQNNKIKIGLENVWNKFLLSPLEFRRFIDEVDNPYVGAYFDVGNIVQFGYPDQWINILNSRIFKVHVKDFNNEIGSILGFTNLLVGDVNWKNVIDALIKVNYIGPLTCELTPYNENPIQLADDTSRALQYIINL